MHLLLHISLCAILGGPETGRAQLPRAAADSLDRRPADSLAVSPGGMRAPVGTSTRGDHARVGAVTGALIGVAAV